MSLQNTSMQRSDIQNKILDLEKKYFSKIEEILRSDNFMEDLLFIEKEIKENYDKFAKIWNIKNKFKIPAERLIRHHIYKGLENVGGVYPSPISSDLGVMLNDCVICIDVKTTDTMKNANDLFSTRAETNQISFDNHEYPCINVPFNLDSMDHYSADRPVLTYVVELVYTDNNSSFELCRDNNYYSMALSCIPNGKLSNLFDYNIVKNVKAYEYYKASDGSAFTPYCIDKSINKKELPLFVENYCLSKGWNKVYIPQDRGTKVAYSDALHKCIWWYTTDNNKRVIAAVKCTSSIRLDKKYLQERFDSKNNTWEGYKTLPIAPPKPAYRN